MVPLTRKRSWRRAWWPTLGSSPWRSNAARKEPSCCSSSGRVWAGAAEDRWWPGGQEEEDKPCMGSLSNIAATKGWKRLITTRQDPVLCLKHCSLAPHPSWGCRG